MQFDSLFRKEVLESDKSYRGVVALTRSTLPMYIVAVVLALIIIGVVAIYQFGPKWDAVVVFLPEEFVAIYSPVDQSSVLTEILVRPGEFVEVGDVLARYYSSEAGLIRDHNPSVENPSIASEVNRIQNEFETEYIELQVQIEAHESQLQSLSASDIGVRGELSDCAKVAEASLGATSPIRMGEILLANQTASLHASIAGLRRRIEIIREYSRRQITELNRKALELRGKSTSISEIRATASGRVSSTLVVQGALTPPMAPLFILSVSDSLDVVAFVSTSLLSAQSIAGTQEVKISSSGTSGSFPTFPLRRANSSVSDSQARYLSGVFSDTDYEVIEKYQISGTDDRGESGPILGITLNAKISLP